MSEMVERVARACEKYLHSRADLGAPINYDDLAREAIAAMRDPTEAMVNEVLASNIDIYWGYAATGGGGPEDAWRAMIDAALK